MNQARSQEHAFTLLELLVALAVIAVLATLLATAVSKAKLRARAIQCSNNLPIRPRLTLLRARPFQIPAADQPRI
jgi:prepilin-type N-terminal cleavage/methylation domain-containing protein